MTSASAIKCALCPALASSRSRIVEMRKVGPGPHRLLYVGQAPGRQEDSLGMPFVGPSGQKLTGTSAEVGIYSYALSNAVRCYPEDDRTPKDEEIKSCTSWLLRDILSLPDLVVVVALGQVASEAIRLVGGLQFKVIETVHPAAVLRNSRLHEQFVESLKEAKSILMGQAFPAQAAAGPPLSWVVRSAQITAAPVAMDVETDGEDGGETVGYSIASPWGGFFSTDLSQIARPSHIYAHFITFDAPRLGRDLYDLSGWDDTSLMAHALRYPELGLKPLFRRITGYPVLTYSQLMTAAREAAKEQGVKVRASDHNFRTALQFVPDLAERYAIGDSQMTATLGMLLLRELQHDNHARRYYFDIEKPTTPIIEKMHRKGVLINRQDLELAGMIYEEAQQVGTVELADIFGVPVSEVNVLADSIIPQLLSVGVHLSLTTPTGRLSTREAVLLNAVRAHSLEQLVARPDKSAAESAIEKVLQVRELRKLKSTYVDSILDKLDGQNFLHGEITQTGPITGRRASRNPNLQNIPIHSPRGKRIRSAFTVPPGYVWLKADASQLELRIFAELSQSLVLLDAFLSGRDVHQEVASILGIPRDSAKTLIYEFIYGGGLDKAAHIVGVERSQADKISAAITERLPSLPLYHAHVRNELTHNGGTVRTMSGWRHTYDTYFSPVRTESEEAFRSACDLKIQGTAAEIMKFASVPFDLACTAVDAWIMLEVHDEFAICVPADRASQLAEELKTVFAAIGRACGLTVPLVLDCTIGPNWVDQTKIER